MVNWNERLPTHRLLWRSVVRQLLRKEEKPRKVEYERKKKLKKTEAPREGHTKPNQERYVSFGTYKAFLSRSPSHEILDEQNPPSGENKERFSKWLERAAYELCEHCTVDNRGHPICLYIYNLPAYCTIENCPYVEEDDP